MTGISTRVKHPFRPEQLLPPDPFVCRQFRRPGLRLHFIATSPVHLTLSRFFSIGQGRDASNYPLNLHGWCLQEYMLSPRLLVFSNWDVEWMCQAGKMEFVHSGPFYQDSGDRGSLLYSSFRLPPGVFGTASARNHWDAFGHTDFGIGYQKRVKLWHQIGGGLYLAAVNGGQ